MEKCTKIQDEIKKNNKNTYSDFLCEVCTYNNNDNPESTCKMCMSPAPATAIKVSVQPKPTPKAALVPVTEDSSDMAKTIVQKKAGGEYLTIQEQLFENRNKEAME